MKAEPTALLDVLLFEPTEQASTPHLAALSLEDAQRLFMQCTRQLVKFTHQRTVPIAQHELKGIHYLIPPYVHGSLISVPKGRVHVVVVDIRRISPGFSNWTDHPLSEHNQHMLWVPPGLGIGLLGQDTQSIVSYHSTGAFSPKHQKTIQWDDPDLAIAWPLAQAPLLAPTDRRGKPFSWWDVPKDSTFGVSIFDPATRF